MRAPFHSRRTFLRGLAGSAIALPYLESFVDAGEAHAQTATAPRRLVIFHTPGGTCPPAWNPTGTETAFTLQDILKPLEPFRSKLLVLQGVAAPSADADGYDNHIKGMAHMLTGTAMANSNDAGGISVDQYIAKRLNAPTKLRSLELGVHTPTGWPPPMSYLGPAQPVPYENDPVKVFMRLFGTTTTSTDAIAAALQRKRSILDGVTAQVGLLKKRLASTDGAKLDAHLSAVRDLETRLTAQAVTGCVVPAKPAPITDTLKNMPALLDVQQRLAVAALACDLTRVVSVMVGGGTPNEAYPWTSSPYGQHELDHSTEEFMLTGGTNQLIKIHRWYGQTYANLVAAMDAVKELDGSLLDHSIVWWVGSPGTELEFAL